MPEGHVVHKNARRLSRAFLHKEVVVDSPQGRFWDGAAAVDGHELTKVEAHGKHLFIGFDNKRWIHVHLGLYGYWGFGEGEAPRPSGEVRLRLRTDDAWAQLRGPAICELLDNFGKKDVIHRLGPDPIRVGTDPESAWTRIHASSVPIGQLLMDQSVLSGVGNIYRAEVLFRHGMSPFRRGADVTREEFDAVWADLVVIMRDGASRGRIDTVRREHSPRVTGRAPRRDRHGGEVYVYRRGGMPCLVCGTPVSVETMQGRTLYWCARCQAA